MQAKQQHVECKHQPLSWPIQRITTTSNVTNQPPAVIEQTPPSAWFDGRQVGRIIFEFPSIIVQIPDGHTALYGAYESFTHVIPIASRDMKLEMALAANVWDSVCKDRKAFVNCYRFAGHRHEFVEMYASNSNVTFFFDRKYLFQVQMYAWQWHHGVIHSVSTGASFSLNDYIRSIETGASMHPSFIKFLNGMQTDYRLCNLGFSTEPQPNELFAGAPLPPPQSNMERLPHAVRPPPLKRVPSGCLITSPVEERKPRKQHQRVEPQFSK
jgi:hypothetical protein